MRAHSARKNIAYGKPRVSRRNHRYQATTSIKRARSHARFHIIGNKFLYLCMANTFSRVYLHIIFAAKGHDDFLIPTTLPRIHQYLGGILKEGGHIPIAVGGVTDHVHLLIGYNLNQPIPDLVKNLKISSANFINSKRLTPFAFKWQRGYACFSHSHSQVKVVAEYIRNQWEHHKTRTFREEIIGELDKRGMKYDPQYLLGE